MTNPDIIPTLDPDCITNLGFKDADFEEIDAIALDFAFEVLYPDFFAVECQ